MSTETPKHDPPRRRLQFSLRTTAIVMLTIAVGLGVHVSRNAKEWEQRAQELEARNAVLSLGGEFRHIVFEHMGPPVHSYIISFEHQPITDGHFMEILPKLEKLPVVVLRLRNTQIGDSAMYFMHRFPYMDELDIGATQVSDAGLRELYKCRGLFQLHCDKTKISAIELDRFHSSRSRMDDALQRSIDEARENLKAEESAASG